MEELRNIMEKFAASGWDLISIPAHAWLMGESNKDTLKFNTRSETFVIVLQTALYAIHPQKNDVPVQKLEL